MHVREGIAVTWRHSTYTNEMQFPTWVRLTSKNCTCAKKLQSFQGIAVTYKKCNHVKEQHLHKRIALAWKNCFFAWKNYLFGKELHHLERMYLRRSSALTWKNGFGVKGLDLYERNAFLNADNESKSRGNRFKIAYRQRLISNSVAAMAF